MSTEDTIKEQIESNGILLYMKGNPEPVSYTHLTLPTIYSV